ncbi:MAG: tRNA (N6-threonylcarbamoyladenosine(37)-N6)-methyltransferase TrmO [Methanocorpusculum sp.]|jgi:tRNA-Thr(GGU) m(6)t(6)A37 methyltransferase TsaA|nr:tRNA (N6-threonylcarbamoyladenosine(37)-N6)-methyltransferase TrmO [Methanocorpusculum sp.]MDD2470294.1 tRNA (N6-threonylcarbamoyladenosine(37)-N6)-methyltransferase TrmO [Methanocorpusculum sp.]MDD3257106.1 tRNA (N6-threonylcarbamoyladenosine(37)-N6)-methyltransferase TrmO [Methanocorpusculum sp.]MDD4132908.1 tRNA (N6-threonylcarbamoyladenosine(37)-N6)-methyltransferase TrmO [Methanocorpusculum sp.]
MSEKFILEQIGVMHSPYTDPMQTPVQSVFTKGRGTIELFPAFADGLDQIASFSHLILITRLHKAPLEMLVETPMVDGGMPHGIFATRHMCRPNRIGFSIVKLLAHVDNRLLIEGVDLLDGTPVLDIKPYIPAFDSVPDASSGWLSIQHLENIRRKSQSL